MKKLLNHWRHFRRDESGAAAVEYGLLAALIAVVIAVSVGTLGTNLKGVFDSVASKIQVTQPGGSGTGG